MAKPPSARKRGEIEPMSLGSAGDDALLGVSPKARAVLVAGVEVERHVASAWRDAPRRP